MERPARTRPASDEPPIDPDARYAGGAARTETVVTGIVLIGLMGFTVTLFSACFDLLPIA